MYIPLTKLVHKLLCEHVKQGDMVVDATTGNGHDSRLLAELVGQTGQVFAFDRQVVAIESARLRLHGAGLAKQVNWLCHGHEYLSRYIPTSCHGRLKAIVFNLGYLPGGDKSVVTRAATTLPALRQAYELLMPSGLLSIIAYTGHAGGREETDAVKQWLLSLQGAGFEMTIPASHNKNAPEWLRIYKSGTI